MRGALLPAEEPLP